jgi:hypothetical protein
MQHSQKSHKNENVKMCLNSWRNLNIEQENYRGITKYYQPENIVHSYCESPSMSK